MKIIIVAGARPNFIKIAPIVHAIHTFAKDKIDFKIVHTGQHFDKKMSASFFQELDIPEPDVNLECGGGTQAEQTANIMVRFENYLYENPVDIVLVVGDVTSTMACAIVAKKLNTKVAHVEAGIRSGDMTMPEEINRIVTDSITDYFFTTTKLASANLEKTHVPDHNIFLVGNTMIDTLLKQLPNFKRPRIWEEASLQEKEYLIVTLHRPANVDNPGILIEILNELIISSGNMKIIFPVHPRTSKKLEGLHLLENNIHFIEPLSYLEFNYLVKKSKAVITDSGGITEETTVMQVPCITLRKNTERPETVEIGTNELIGVDPQNIKPALNKLLSGNWKKGSVPYLWDGRTAERIVKILAEINVSGK